MAGSLTRLGDGLLGESLNDGGFVALSVDEAVVDNLDGGVLGGEHGDAVGNGGSVDEGGNVLANTSEVEDEVLAVGTGQLGLALLAQNGELCLGVLRQHLPDGPGHTRVDTTAETLVGAAHHDQRLLALALYRLGLGLLENGVGGLSVGTRVGHGPLGAGELGGGDNLHGLCDFLNVLDRLETALDLAQGGVGCGIVVNEGSGPRESKISQFLMQLAMQWRWVAGCSGVVFSLWGVNGTVRRRRGQPSARGAQLEKASLGAGEELRWSGDGRQP